MEARCLDHQEIPMSTSHFLHWFFRGLPSAIVFALFVFASLAIVQYRDASRAADIPVTSPSALAIDEKAEVSGLPRECDLPAGISTDCLFLD
jgi:hypothetical protein